MQNHSAFSITGRRGKVRDVVTSSLTKLWLTAGRLLSNSPTRVKFRTYLAI